MRHGDFIMLTHPETKERIYGFIEEPTVRQTSVLFVEKNDEMEGYSSSKHIPRERLLALLQVKSVSRTDTIPPKVRKLHKAFIHPPKISKGQVVEVECGKVKRQGRVLSGGKVVRVSLDLDREWRGPASYCTPVVLAPAVGIMKLWSVQSYTEQTRSRDVVTLHARICCEGTPVIEVRNSGNGMPDTFLPLKGAPAAVVERLKQDSRRWEAEARGLSDTSDLIGSESLWLEYEWAYRPSQISPIEYLAGSQEPKLH